MSSRVDLPNFKPKNVQKGSPVPKLKFDKDREVIKNFIEKHFSDCDLIDFDREARLASFSPIAPNNDSSFEELPIGSNFGNATNNS